MFGLDRHRSHRHGIALMVGAMACFALSDLFAKRLSGSGMPVHEIGWYRFAALAATIAAATLVRGGTVARSTKPLWQIGRGVLIVVSALLFIAALRWLPVATATALVFSSPLFIIALSAGVLRERVPAARWAWAGLGFIGVVIVAQPEPGGTAWAALLPIASSAAWAGAVVLTRRLGDDDAVPTTQAYSCATGLVLLTASLWPLGFAMPTSTQALDAIVMATCWAGAQWLIVAVYAQHEASTVAPYAYTQLLWATLLGIVALQSWPTPTTLAGALVIAAAGIGAARVGRGRAAAGSGPG